MTSAMLGGVDAGFYQLPTDLKTITGTVDIGKIYLEITVETSKTSEFAGEDITVTLKITNPTGVTIGFHSASEIAIAPTNAALKPPLAQQGTTSVYKATYTLATYSTGTKASFKVNVPNTSRLRNSIRSRADNNTTEVGTKAFKG